MASSFRDLKKSRDQMFEALNKQLTDQSKKGGGRPEEDVRFWYPQTDKAGNGFAIIRFLPAPTGEAVPYIREYSHGFKGPGGWYIQRSLSTIGKKDPVGEYNRAQWAKGQVAKDQGNTAVQKQYEDGCKNRKRNTGYIANILVEQDTANPENNGKVFLYRYGLKIQGMIEEKMKPQFEGESPMNPFDPWEGASLKLKITTNKPVGNQKKGFKNYDKSEWTQPSPLGSDEEIEKIWKQEHPLQPFIAEDTFESYQKLEAMFNRAMGFDKRDADNAMEDEQEAPAEVKHKSLDEKFSKKASEPKEEVPWSTDDSSDDDDDDDLAKFRALAQM